MTEHNIGWNSFLFALDFKQNETYFWETEEVNRGLSCIYTWVALSFAWKSQFDVCLWTLCVWVSSFLKGTHPNRFQMTGTLVCCKHVLDVLPQATTASQAVTICKMTALLCWELCRSWWSRGSLGEWSDCLSSYHSAIVWISKLLADHTFPTKKDVHAQIRVKLHDERSSGWDSFSFFSKPPHFR